MNVHVYAPPVSEWRIDRAACPYCGQRSVIVRRFYEWHGWYSACMRCGDRWTPDERLERPFSPRWRRNNIADMRRAWKSRRME